MTDAKTNALRDINNYSYDHPLFQWRKEDNTAAIVTELNIMLAEIKNTSVNHEAMFDILGDDSL